MARSEHPEFRVTPDWRKTGNACFPTAARVGDQWWVLRVNNFPDHPIYTLFVGGHRRFDVDDTPRAWGEPADKGWPRLSDLEAAEALSGIEDFVAYGSEVGRACDNPFCCG